VTQPHIWYVHAEEVRFFLRWGYPLGKEEKKTKFESYIRSTFFFSSFFPFCSIFWGFLLLLLFLFNGFYVD
jgi:hypothetical protein